jgi:hypothetical protein
LPVVELADDHRDFVQAGSLSRAPAAFAGDDLVSAIEAADKDRLQNAVSFHRGDEFRHRRFIELAAGLAWVGNDIGDGQAHNAGCSGGGRRRDIVE